MSKNQLSTSDTGGWCNKETNTYHTDKGLASALAKLFAGCTVIGLGDGRGGYRKLILSTGKVKRYDAYDAAPNIAKITGGQVV